MVQLPCQNLVARFVVRMSLHMAIVGDPTGLGERSADWAEPQAAKSYNKTIYCVRTALVGMAADLAGQRHQRPPMWGCHPLKCA